MYHMRRFMEIVESPPVDQPPRNFLLELQQLREPSADDSSDEETTSVDEQEAEETPEIDTGQSFYSSSPYSLPSGWKG